MKIAVAQGDGVGKEVIPPCIEILNLVLKDPKFIDLDIGYSKWAREGAPITDSDIDLIKQTDCMLFGAVTTAPGSSVVVRLRRTFDLFANLRPFRSYDLTPHKLNVTVIRENLEGLYAGIEEVSADTAVTKRVITRYNTERLASFASGLENVKKITIVHKANVLKSDVFFRDICARILDEHHISYDEMYVDTAAYNLIKHPEIFDHILTSNLFGDILSDEAAGLTGGLGLCPSANIGPDYAIFEPIHGSAPDIAGRGIADPIGAILSVKMLLEWAGKQNKAMLLDNAVKKTIENGVTTPDLGGKNSTKEVTRSILSCL
ncbi:MAG: isocitrate/isopropylmalate dehydrogenase family protein [Halobacteriota archaeon]